MSKAKEHNSEKVVADGQRIEQNELYVGFCRDKNVRTVASAGGVVSAILLHALESGIIDAAVVSRIASESGKVSAVTEIVETREKILAHAGSYYIDTPVLHTLKSLRTYEGRVAIVALPCQVRALRKIFKKDKQLRDKVVLMIGLFCRGNLKVEFYEDYFRRHHIDPRIVEAINIRRGHLNGEVFVHCKDGSNRRLSFREMNMYRIAGVHAKAFCYWCSDHLSAEADIAVGDIFHPEYKLRSIKHSAFICRSDAGRQIIQSLIVSGFLEYEFFGLRKYKRYFAKLEEFSNNLGSRYLAASLMQTPAPQSKKGKVNLFHSLAWAIYLLNRNLSSTKRGRRFLFILPLPCISCMAYAVKMLSRL